MSSQTVGADRAMVDLRALSIGQNSPASSQFVNRIYQYYLKDKFYPSPSNFFKTSCTIFSDYFSRFFSTIPSK